MAFFVYVDIMGTISFKDGSAPGRQSPSSARTGYGLWVAGARTMFLRDGIGFGKPKRAYRART
jgi:hypothetical protein